ncbi:MAG: hypothetical protein HRT41_10610 [Campylobacteraceae bacterium]|nr:hypothetical protein [Campylobacteraceae bacterium]
MSIAKFTILSILPLLFFTGCYSEKILRTKPTTFIDMNPNVESADLYQCIDTEEELYTKKEDINQNICRGYTTVSKKNIMKIAKEDLPSAINKLFYISDNNCKQFIEKFKYNYIKQDVAGKILSLNLFGVGLKIGGIADISSQQFVNLSDTLNENLKKRQTIREKILLDYLTKTDSTQDSKNTNTGVDALLVSFIQYDKTCSLVRTFD